MNPVNVAKITPKSCPFCGSTSISIVIGSTGPWVAATCNQCDAQGPEVDYKTIGNDEPSRWWEDAEQKAYEAWNRREPEA